MKRSVFLILILLTACSTAGTPAASFPDLTPAAANLGMSSTSAQIQRAMIESAPRWTSLQMEGMSTWFAPNGDMTQAYQEKAWLDPLNNRYKIEMHSAIYEAEKF